MVNKEPNELVKKEELFADYKTWFNKLTEIRNLKKKKAFKDKSTAEQQAELDKLFYEKVFALEKDKMLYFFLTYPQQTVLIKVGKKQAEKDFFGYEFRNRRGHEGIKVYRGENGSLATKLYDDQNHLNPKKASYYVYQAFLQEQKEVEQSLKKNIAVFNLLELMNFKKRVFEKSISLGVKKKANFKSIWKTNKLTLLSSIANIQKGNTITKAKTVEGRIPVVAGGQEPAYFHNTFNREAGIITVSASGAYSGFVNFWSVPIFASDCNTIKSIDETKISTKLIYYFLKFIQPVFYDLQRGQAQPHVYASDIEKIRIPLPSKDAQQKIITEISAVEQKEKARKEKVKSLKEEISNIIKNATGSLKKLGTITTKIGSGATPKGGKTAYQSSGISLIRSQNVYDFGFVEKGLAFINDEQAKKLDNVTIEKNDVLFNITGASIARCCIVDEKYLPARVNQHVSIIRTNEKAIPKYVQMILISPEYKNQLLQIGEGATSRQAITKQQLEEFKIPLPSIEEQKKIVSAILELEKEITAIEADLANIDNEKEQILRKYLE